MFLFQEKTIKTIGFYRFILTGLNLNPPREIRMVLIMRQNEFKQLTEHLKYFTQRILENQIANFMYERSQNRDTPAQDAHGSLRPRMAVYTRIYTYIAAYSCI